MQGDELERWREANRLFAIWLAQDEDGRDAWLSAQEIAGDVGSLLRQLIARQQSPDAGTLSLDAMLDVTAPRVPATNALAGRRVGEWTLLDELGRGGMSVVYRARRSGDGYEQIAAVKLLGMAALGSEGSARFEHERAVLARLRHPHIATLIDGGIADDGTPYLVMALVDGQNLADHCRAHGLGWRERVALMRSVCDAVAYAHRNLLVHRDIKPSNILVTGEGVPVLLDFGIAKLLDDKGEHTRTGMRALTPGYAAPEQVKADTITTATDVYALGVVLRNLCDGIQPLPADLRNIIGKATRAEPERRYPDARALGDDLDNLLQQKPVQATPDSWPYRLRVLLRRRRGAVMASTLVVMSLLVGLGLALWQYQRAAHEAAEARHQAARAQASRDFLFSIVNAGNRNRADEADLPVSQIIARGVAALEDDPPGDTELHAEMAMMLGELEGNVGRYDSAEKLFDASATQLAGLERHELWPGLHLRRGLLANARGDPEAAIAHFETALESVQTLPLERQALLVPTALDGWAHAMDRTGHSEQARQRLRQTMTQAPYATPGSPAHAALVLSLVSVTRDPQQRLELLTQVRDHFATSPPTVTDRIALAHNLAVTYNALGRAREALPWVREAVNLSDRAHPGATIRRARSYNNLGSTAANAFALDEALQALDTARMLYRELDDDSSSTFAALLNNQGLLLRDIGHVERALPILQQSLALAQRHFGEDDPRSLSTQRNVALTLALAGATSEADALWQQAAQRLPDTAAVSQRLDMQMAGALIAVLRQDRDAVARRRAEVEHLLAADNSGAVLDARRRSWNLGIAALERALHSDNEGANQLFAQAAASEDEQHSDWAPARHNRLAWARLLDRAGRTDDAKAQRDAAMALLRAGGLEVDADSGAAVLPE